MLDRIAAASSRPVHEVEAALRRQPGTNWDEQGRLVGFGVTLRPTRHRLTFDGGPTVFTWCASDAIVAPFIVGRAAILESPCAVTGPQIRVQVTPDRVESVDPPTAVVSLVRPDRMDHIRREDCELGNFAVSEDAAADWLDAHPAGMVHSVEEDFRLHREIAEKFGWTLSRHSSHNSRVAQHER